MRTPLAFLAIAVLAHAGVDAAQPAKDVERGAISALPTAPPPPQTAPYPAVAVLDAFRAACFSLATLKDAQRQVIASGWTKARDPDATPVGELVRFGREAGKNMLGGKGVLGAPAVFSKTVAGEALHLVLSGVRAGGRTVIGCRLYDVGETRRISADTATAWIGRAPETVNDQPALFRAAWRPGLAASQDSFELYFVPANSVAVTLVKITGIAMTADEITAAS